MVCQEKISRPINGYRAMKIAFENGISKAEIVQGMKNDEFEYEKGVLHNGDPETLLDDSRESWFRADEQSFRGWIEKVKGRRLYPQDVQRMFANIQLSIGYLRREIAQIRLGGRI